MTGSATSRSCWPAGRVVARCRRTTSRWRTGGVASATPPPATRTRCRPIGCRAADALLVLAAHISRHGTLTEWMDASITDEHRPFDRDPELNLYDPSNPHQPPYSADFVERYRAAQVARNRRITDWVREQLECVRAPRTSRTASGRSWCTARWQTRAGSIRRSTRANAAPNWCFLGDPKVVNDGPVGLARFCTLRSWLSQWSIDRRTRRRPAQPGPRQPTVLVVGNTADDACTPSHTHRLYEAIPHDRSVSTRCTGRPTTTPAGTAVSTSAEAIGVIGEFLEQSVPG